MGRAITAAAESDEQVTISSNIARGGSIDFAGPAVADGMLILTSGYGLMGGLTGNLLVAFSRDGK